MARFVKFAGAGPYVPAHFVLDGAAGTFLSTDDVNLLDADTAHMLQGFPYNGARATAVNNGVLPSGWGSQLATITAIDGIPRTQTTALSTPITAVPHVASWLVTNNTGHDQTFDANVVVDSGNNFTSSFGPLAAGATAVMSVSFTPPAGTVTALWLRFLLGDLAVNDQFIVSEVMVRQGTDPTFVPSLRVVGDYDSEVDANIQVAQPSGTARLLLHGSVNTDDAITLHRSANSDAVIARSFEGAVGSNIATNTLTLGVRSLVRSTYVDDAGSLTGNIEIDTVSGVPGVTPGAKVSPKGPLHVGANSTDSELLTGDIFSASVKDGIAGPDVARCNPNDYTGAAGAIPDGTIWVDSVTGRTWKANGTVVFVANDFGDAVAVPNTGFPANPFIVKNPPSMPDVLDNNFWVVGSGWVGDGFTATMHDGVDATGPVVAEYDAADIGI